MSAELLTHLKWKLQRRASCVVDAEVEQEATHGGYDHKSRQRKALQLCAGQRAPQARIARATGAHLQAKWRDAVQRAEAEAKAVQPLQWTSL